MIAVIDQVIAYLQAQEGPQRHHLETVLEGEFDELRISAAEAAGQEADNVFAIKQCRRFLVLMRNLKSILILLH